MSVWYPVNGNDAILLIHSTGQTLTFTNFRAHEWNRDYTLEFADGTEIHATAEGSPFYHIIGTEEADIDLKPFFNNGNYIYGEAGDDLIKGNSGDDYIDGGSGNDNLNGGSGNDTYVFGSSSGNDVIYDSSGINRVKFIDLNSTDMSVFYPTNGYDAVLMIHETGQTLTFADFRKNEYNRNYILEFADKTEIHATAEGSPFHHVIGTEEADADIKSFFTDSIIEALGGDDVVNDCNGSNYIYGEAGNDTINGNNGDDCIDGGAGNDNLNGGSGNDTYVFGSASGNDVIYDGSGINNVKFTDFNPADMSISYPENSKNAVITIHETGQTLTFTDFGRYEYNRNFIFEFSDGSTAHIDYKTAEFVIDVKEAEQTESVENAEQPADETEALVQENAELLESLYTEEVSSEITMSQTTETIISDAISISEETEEVFDQTDLQVMILTENMSAFGEEENVFDNTTFTENSDSGIIDQMLVNTMAQ